MIRILFVCTGNICRSPTAEGVFRDLVDTRDLADRFAIDSAGMIGYHVGEPPDPRSVRMARDRGVDLSGQRARKIHEGDFEDFDYLLAMDRSHYEDMLSMAPERHRDKIHLFLSFCEDAATEDVPDPYYGGSDGFVHTFDLITSGADAFLNHVRGEHGL